MNSLLNTLNSASSGMLSQSDRIRIVSENVANADTPGYRRKLVSFRNVVDDGGVSVKTGPVTLDRSDLLKSFDPSHPMADEAGYVKMTNVDLAVEIADAREAQRGYEANVSIFDQARKMYGGVLELLKR